MLIGSVPEACKLNRQKTCEQKNSIQLLFDVNIFMFMGVSEKSEKLKEVVRLGGLSTILTKDITLLQSD